MPVSSSDSRFFDEHLAAVGVRHGMNVVVHSNLMSFGRVPGGAEAVYDALRRAVGLGGTIAVPTFTFHLGAADVMDPATTPSRGVGALSEWVRKLPAAHRSGCPIHGFAAVGPAAEEIAGAAVTSSLGPDSAFERMHSAGFHLLLLGCSFQQGATFVHYVEAQVGVPYREWVKLPRQIRDPGGMARPIAVDYYARRKDTPVQVSLHSLQQHMVDNRLVTAAAGPYGASLLVGLDVLYTTTAALLGIDRYALVARR